jgi:uncharacterized protein YbjQ (UPF0145 family)
VEVGAVSRKRGGLSAQVGAVAADQHHTGVHEGWGSLFSAQEFAAVTGVGFDPVGQVFGAAVVHLGYANRAGRCSGSWSYTPRTDLASDPGGPFKALLGKLYRARGLALSRAVERCGQLGGDGIVGVTVRVRPFPAGGTEFSVQGTALRARTAVRPAAPFTAHISPQEFARLLRGGWVPVGLVFGISLASRHDGADTRRQTRLTANREVVGFSALVKDVRRDARSRLHEAVAAQGADGVIAGAMTLGVSERECPAQEGQHDHMAEAVVLGTGIASFDRRPGPRDRAPLTIMHLGASVEADGSPRPAEPTGALRAVPPQDIPEGRLLDRYTARRAAARVRRAERNPLHSIDTAPNAGKPQAKRGD